jgi:triacylglycerol esterase/lipase EstA (alpha/beta hydrolase family)
MRRVALAAILFVLASASSAIAKPQYPVPYTFSYGLASSVARAGQPPPGANQWSCKPSAAHPYPVVLLHGLFENMTNNWQTLSPLLANNGYCVYALTYGDGRAGPYVGGIISMEQSARQVNGFVDRVLRATGAPKVDLVTYSEGTLVGGWFTKFLGPAKVARFVGMAAIWHGTSLYGIATVGTRLAEAYPRQSQSFRDYCEACVQFAPQSSFIKRLNAGGGPTVPGVIYTNILTRYDQLVVPYTSGIIDRPGVTNIVVQDKCASDGTDHLQLIAEPVAAQHVLNALDPAHAKPAPCTVVAPYVVGAPVPVSRPPG